MKLGMLFVNSGQFNQENFEFVNFPDFCGYFRFPTDCNHTFKKIFTRKHIFAKFCFLKLVSNKVRIRRVNKTTSKISNRCRQNNTQKWNWREILTVYLFFWAQVCQGGKVPESFYMSPDGEELDHMSVAHVAHGEKLRLQYGVTELGCILR